MQIQVIRIYTYLFVKFNVRYLRYCRLVWTVHPDRHRGIFYCVAKEQVRKKNKPAREIVPTRLDSVLATMPEAFVVLNGEWIIKYWNPQSENLLGLEKSSVLVIKDDGKGFEPDQKKTGVGLSNMKSRTDLLNGIMTVHSAPGCGCTITVQIPTAPPIGKPFQVVAVEGNLEDQRILREAFSEVAPQHTLIFSRNVQQAVELLYFLPERDLPGLILLDCPWQNECDMKALHVLEESQRLKKIPKIIYSTTKPAGYRPLSATAGGTVYLQKREGFCEQQEDIRQMLLFSAGACR